MARHARSDAAKAPCGPGANSGATGTLDTFYGADLLVGLSLPFFVHLTHRSRADRAVVVRLFWLGVAIGATWEVPIFLSAIFATEPIVSFLREPPFHPALFMLAHTFWDGGIFLAGLALVTATRPPPALGRFSAVELVVFVLWGQVSEFAVEAVSVLSRAWVYSDAVPWNPVLFHVSGYPITLVPQLIWLVAPVVYYFCALRLVARARRGR